MYLSDLNIIGFKSFAGKTHLKFTDGITAIVGPNGCGKTNIVDAIRWVLGEQKSSILRSDVMEDVIFNGTNKRKPLSMAEVSLTLQNNKNILPTEYTEVTISRQLFRDGSSNYYLNKTRCRLKNIVDLFMDTGLGADSYSVIELKMVEAILSGKPEERRNLLEEAAGVKKYKQRRKEANRKLQTIQDDLIRVNDIVAEIQTQVNSLSRQASKTKRYNKLSEELKELEIKLLAHQYDDYKTKIVSFKNDFDEINKSKDEFEKQLNEIEIIVSKIKDELFTKENAFNDFNEKESQLQAELSQTKQNIAVGNEKIYSLNSNQERITNELKQFENNYSQLNKQVESINKTIKLITDKKEQIKSELKLVSEQLNSVKSEVQIARDESKDSSEEVIKIQNTIQNLHNEITKSNNRIESLRKSIEDSANEIKNLQEKHKAAQKELEIENLKIGDFDKRISMLEEKFKTAQEEKQSISNEIDNLKEELSKYQTELNTKNSSLDFLSSLQDSDESINNLIADNDWKTSQPKTLLAELLGTDDKYRIAIGSLLGTYAKCLVVTSQQEADEAVSRLKTKDKGKAAFIIKENIPEINNEFKTLNESGVHGNLSEIIRTDNKLLSLLNLIFEDTFIVENDDIAKKLITEQKCKTCVTLDGNTYKQHYLRGGSKVKSEGAFVGKKERIETLNKNISELNKKINTLSENLANKKEKYKNIDLIEINSKLKNANNEKNTQLQIISQKQYVVKGIEQNLDILKKNAELFEKEIIELENEIQQSKFKITEFEEKLELLQEEQKSKSTELLELEEELSQKEEEYKEIQLRNYRYEQEILSNEKELNTIKDRLNGLEQTEIQRKKEFEENTQSIEKLNLNLKQLENKKIDFEKEFQDKSEHKTILQNEIRNIKNELEQQSNEQNTKRKELDRVILNLHQKELYYNELKSKQESVIQKATESYDINIEQEQLYLDENFSIDETTVQLNEIKDKLTKLGSVNFLALEEYETQNERLKFYTSQINDLIESEKNLVETISEINQNAKEKFLSTFESININFQKLFKELFGQSGESELKLSEGDPLESNIEIIAKPPSKKPRNIEALSGGEKTLTAIALLFAIYLVKPSPFCILDEVDAPLDDANIDKFIHLIRTFSNNTQFLIVTHNKKSMEAADNLYGITMEEVGISKVVSVRLDSEQNKITT